MTRLMRSVGVFSVVLRLQHERTQRSTLSGAQDVLSTHPSPFPACEHDVPSPSHSHVSQPLSCLTPSPHLALAVLINRSKEDGTFLVRSWEKEGELGA